MSSFVVVVESFEARSEYGKVITKNGQKLLVTFSEGWDSSSDWNGNINSSSNEPKLFESIDSATAFARKWEGHPWYCKPNGNFEIIEVRPVYKQVQDGYEIVKVVERTP